MRGQDMAQTTKAAATKAAAATAAREDDFRTDVIAALDKAWDGATDKRAAIRAGWETAQRIIRKADTPEDKRDAARAYVALLDRLHGGLSLEDADAAVTAAQEVRDDVKAAQEARQRVIRLLLAQGIAEGDVAATTGVSVQRVRQVKGIEALRTAAREGKQSLTRDQAARIMRESKVKAAKAALKAGTPVLDVLPDVAPKSKPDSNTSAAQDMAAALQRITRGLPSIVVGKDDADAVKAVAAAAAALAAWADSHSREQGAAAAA